MTEQIPLEDLLNQHQFRIERLENAVIKLADHIEAQNHLMQMLSRQLQQVAMGSSVDIRPRFN
jgi:flagellar biosynthesis chaperone FliJ